MLKRITILSLLFTFLSSISYSQNFPVRVTPILTPPYTPFLTDYTDAGSEKLTVQIVLNDVTVPEYRCKLRLSIEGVNISITTNPNYVPLPIVLSGGVPQIVYGSDLSEYFKPSNLVFQGINQNEFERKGSQLPEGIYRISIEVLDYNRGTVVSNKGSATAWMILNDPPFINMPVNNSKLRPLNPQNIVFQWAPRHRGSPNAAFTTEYEVKLVEIWPQGRNPYDAINTSRPIFETTVGNTLVVYGPAETPLVLGREYALQVRALDTGGKDLFKNNGYSEVIRFVYGNECPVPTSFFSDDIGTVKARVRWQGSGQNTSYILRIREKKESASWFEDHTDQTFVNLLQLKPGTTYEYQVNGECESFRSEWSAVQTFTTLAVNPDAFVCGSPGTVPLFDKSPPLPMLFINDFINAGGFDVVVTKATGGNGKFSGEGLAVIPWFNSAKVRMTFKDISVNKSYQLTAGDFVSVSVMDSKSLLKIEDKTPAEGTKPGEGQVDKDVDAIKIAGVIDTVYVNSEGGIVVLNAEGKEEIFTPKKDEKTGEVRPMSITDTAGNSYTVDKDGKVSKMESTGGGNVNAAADAAGIKFPFFVIYGHDLDKTIYYCTNATLDEKIKSEFEVLIKTRIKASSWSDMPESQVVFDGDCSIPYTNNLTVRKGAIAYSEQNKKIFFADLSKDYDFVWKLNETDYTLGSNILETDLKRGSNSLELDVLTKSTAALHTKVTLQIDYGKFDINDYRVKVVRDNKTYYYKDQQFIGGVDGELPLKEDESIQLTFEQVDDQGNWKTLENTEWLLSLSAENKVTNTTLAITFSETFTHDNLDILVPGSVEKVRIDFEKETTERAEEENTVLDPVVDRLADNLQKKRKDLFSWAMNTIQTKNATLYSSITGVRASTKVYIVPANDTDFAKHTAGINGNVRGVTIFEANPYTNYYPLLETINSQLNGKVIVSATLISKLEAAEIGYIKKAIEKKTKTDHYEFFYNKIKNYSAELGALLDKAMAEGAIASIDLDKLVYKVGTEDVSKFIDMVTSTKDVFLSDANIKTSSEGNYEPFERTFIKTLAHELTHIHFKVTQKLDYLTWEIIRKKNNGQYDLKDQLGNNCACSAGSGHECHNPENSTVCGEENKYNTVKKAK